MTRDELIAYALLKRPELTSEQAAAFADQRLAKERARSEAAMTPEQRAQPAGGETLAQRRYSRWLQEHPKATDAERTAAGEESTRFQLALEAGALDRNELGRRVRERVRAERPRATDEEVEDRARYLMTNPASIEELERTLGERASRRYDAPGEPLTTHGGHMDLVRRYVEDPVMPKDVGAITPTPSTPQIRDVSKKAREAEEPSDQEKWDRGGPLEKTAMIVGAGYDIWKPGGHVHQAINRASGLSEIEEKARRLAAERYAERVAESDAGSAAGRQAAMDIRSEFGKRARMPASEDTPVEPQ